MQGVRISHEPTSADILERILDKGIVIDAWAMISLAGLDLLSLEVRVVVAAIETYVNYPEHVKLTTPGARPPFVRFVGA